MDIIGDIAIIYNLSQLNKIKDKVNCVFLHKGMEGEFRIRKLEFLYGKEHYETLHKENKCKFLLDVRLFYSTRLTYERKYVSSKVFGKICVFFAGVGPFPIVISKHSKAEEIIGVEKNPKAYEYFLKNIELNKCKNVKAILGDAVEYAINNPKTFDFIVMPKPKEGLYLECLESLKPNGVCFYYHSIKEDPEKYFENLFSSYGKIIEIKKVRSFSPKEKQYRVVIQKY